MKVTFDPAKREITLRERGLDFTDAEKVFLGRHTVLRTDRNDESRYISAGYLSGRMVVIVWTPRQDARHIILMRHCHAKEEARRKKHLD